MYSVSLDSHGKNSVLVYSDYDTGIVIVGSYMFMNGDNYVFMNGEDFEFNGAT
jgi:hypothetical protein